MNKKISIVHVGVSGVPFERSAAINRCIAFYSIFSKEKFTVLAISKRAISNVNESIKKKGVYSGISYQFTTPSPFKSSNFFKRRFSNFIGPINEFFLILNLVLKKKIDIVFFYPKGLFFELVYYSTLSKLFRFKLVSHYVEFRSSFENRKNNWLRINDLLFDKYFMYFVDGAIPISEFLTKQIKRKKNDLPMVKIPPIINFNLYAKFNNKKETKKYFLYVGATGYHAAIESILDAFELIKNKKSYLVLILHGSGIESIKKKISQHPKKDLIRVESNLEMKKLQRYYLNAQALLVPLSDSIQDKARFPQKISEYLASGNPIITTNFGEVKYYFKDELNALVVEKNDPTLLAEKMNFIIENPLISKEIGLNGYKTGLKHFDSNSYHKIINKFIIDVIKI